MEGGGVRSPLMRAEPSACAVRVVQAECAGQRKDSNPMPPCAEAGASKGGSEWACAAVLPAAPAGAARLVSARRAESPSRPGGSGRLSHGLVGSQRSALFWRPRRHLLALNDTSRAIRNVSSAANEALLGGFGGNPQKCPVPLSREKSNSCAPPCAARFPPPPRARPRRRRMKHSSVAADKASFCSCRQCKLL